MGQIQLNKFYPISQNNDSLLQKGAIQVVVPRPDSLKIKIEPPAIKSFDFEAEVPVRRQPAPAKVNIPAPAEEQLQIAPETQVNIDTMIFRRFTSGDASPYLKVIYDPHTSGDSIEYLTHQNYYHTVGTGENQGEITESDTLAFSTDNAEESDSFTANSGKIQWTEQLLPEEPARDIPAGSKPLLNQEWFLSLIIFSVALTGLLRLKWRKYLKGIFSSVLFPNVASSLHAEKSHTSRLASFGLGFLFYLNSSLFIFEILTFEGRGLLGLDSWKALLTIFGFLMVIFTAKIIVYRFVSWVFMNKEAVNDYLFQSALLSKAFAVILLPIVAIFPFANELLKTWLAGTGVVIFILLYLIQIERGISINLKDTVSGYYIILYLCALEILPLGILYKVLFV